MPLPSDRHYTVDDFDYHLPPELIAQHPSHQRADSRLLVVNAPHQAGLTHSRFSMLGAYLQAGDLLVINNTQVMAARLLGVKRDSAGKIEVLVERVLETDLALAMVRASKTPKDHSMLRFGDYEARVEGRQGMFFLLRFNAPVAQVLRSVGQTPLPPYITHKPQADDEQRYQTVYAKVPGAVAAPTAGLHFDHNLLEVLRESGVQTAEITLHVGAGTFQPVRVQAVKDHVMHSEWYDISEASAQAINATKAAGGRVVAVGTTSMRSLESAVDAAGLVRAGSRDTSLFITPGYSVRVVDVLITNFHLPRSTLMMLVSAFAGFNTIKAAYQEAISQQYRFFSYGDAMLLHRAANGGLDA
jgi:S-adenosylmethionine:tRNA ribosyltransferase-isomerase